MSGQSAETDTEAQFCRRLNPTERSVRATLGEVCGWMRQRHLDDDDIGTAELVVAEILNNVVEHAYPSKRDGWISLRVDDLGDFLSVSVVEGGAAMAGGILPETDLPRIDTAAASMPEGGFGWALIRRLAQDLAYRRRNGRNRVSLNLRCSGRRD